jgi:cytochrome b6-f complex iron-sulfur subunit
MQRRDFLQLSWNLLLGTAAAGGGYVGFRYMSSLIEADEGGTQIIAGSPDVYEPGSVVAFNAAGIYLVRMEDGGFLALSRICTHLDCVVLWNGTRFNCPCHGSQFARDGDVINDPAPRPLDQYAIELDGEGRLVIDTATVIERDESAPEDRFYVS